MRIILLILLGLFLGEFYKHHFFWNEKVGNETRRSLYDKGYTLVDIKQFIKAGITEFPEISAEEMNKNFDGIYKRISGGDEG